MSEQPGISTARPDLYRRIQELEAQCAAMRAALLAVERATEPMQAGDCLGCTWNPGHDLTCPVGNALASDAGKQLLERLEKAEELFQQTTNDKVEMMGKIIAMSDGWKGAYAQALEEAAKVAEDYIVEGSRCDKYIDENAAMIADDIRALKEGE